MNNLEKQIIYSAILRLANEDEILSPAERRDVISELCRGLCDMSLDEILNKTQNNRKLRLKRGDTATNDAYTGLAGEITMDTDTGIIRVHDGETVGGVAMARAMDLITPYNTVPDYTQGTELIFTDTNVAPQAGFFEVTGKAFNERNLVISINGTSKIVATSTNSTFSTTGFVLLPVKQGDTIQGISSYNNTGSIIFYPMCK